MKKHVSSRLKLVRTLAASRYGADQDVLLRTFETMMVSILELGFAAHGSTRQPILDQLQITFNEGLQIALGAFKTTRTTNLLNEAGMKSLQLRRDEKTATFGLRVLGMQRHPLEHQIRSTHFHQY